MKELLKEWFGNTFAMVFLFGGDVFSRLVIQPNHDEFPKYYWLGVAIIYATALLRKLSEKK